MSGWLSKSGGLFYHFKSLRFQNSLWLPFQRELENFFDEALKNVSSLQKENLILVGGSGGHCLPDSFLRNFENIHHIDIDPLAAWFFRWRHPGLKVNFIRGDAFEFLGAADQKQLQGLSPQNSTWMWSNLLGQLGFSMNHQEAEKRLFQVKRAMEGRTWFSFHDLYSFTSSLSFSELSLKPSYQDWNCAQRDLSCFPRLELRDHLTNGIFSFKKKGLMVWPLTPFEIHFVEGGFTSSDSSP